MSRTLPKFLTPKVLATYQDATLDASKTGTSMFPDSVDLKVVDNTVYVVGANKLEIIDVSNPSSPQLLGSYTPKVIDAASKEMPFYSPNELVDVANNKAFILTSKGLEIVDVSNPQKPVFLGLYEMKIPLMSYPEVKILDNQAYINIDDNYSANPSSSIQIVDLSDSSKPTLLGTYSQQQDEDNFGSIGDIEIIQNTMYVHNDSYMGLNAPSWKIIDISNPANPELFASIDSIKSSDLFVAGNTAYYVDGEKFQLIDTRNPKAPKLTNAFMGGEGYILNIEEKTMYISSFGDLFAFDISDAQNGKEPTALWRYTEKEPYSYSAINLPAPTVRQDKLLNGGFVINQNLMYTSTTDGFKISQLDATNYEIVLGRNLKGTKNVDKLVGDAGKDTLDGGVGADTLIGGLNNDVYVVDNKSDVVIEESNREIESYGYGSLDPTGIAGGLVPNTSTRLDVDLVKASASFTLSANVENLTLTGKDKINGTGNELANTLKGNAANNVLTGFDGDDYLYGWAGSDSLVGGNGNDSLDGGDGNDNLKGELGNDSLNGGEGNDSIIGGKGFDSLTGGKGADKFIFSSIDDIAVSKNTIDNYTSTNSSYYWSYKEYKEIDSITDFNSLDGDKIDLSAIDANIEQSKDQIFSEPVVGTSFPGKFLKAGELYFDSNSSVLYGNNDNGSEPDFAIKVTGVKSLVTGDFVL